MIKDSKHNIALTGSQDGTGRFAIYGAMNFDSVTPLQLQSDELFRPFQHIQVDLSAVTSFNSAGLALLLEWKRQTLLNKKSIHISGLPEKLLNIAHVSEIEDIIKTML